jgi:hypothetical protein
MNLTTQNLFPLPTWAPALQRVPTPLAELNQAFLCGERAPKTARLGACGATAEPSCLGRQRGRRWLSLYALNSGID